MKKIILIIGTIITLILAILWYLDFISEPVVTIGSGILTLLGYFFIPEKNEKVKKTINQKHSGPGDNIAGDKIVIK